MVSFKTLVKSVSVKSLRKKNTKAPKTETTSKDKNLSITDYEINNAPKRELSVSEQKKEEVNQQTVTQVNMEVQKW